MVVLYIITTLLFNPDYKALFNYLFPKKEKTENEEDSMVTNDDNMHIINPIKDEEIQEDVISETVNFGEVEEITDENNENTTAEIIDETEELKGKDENEEFEIEIPDEEETVDAEEIGEKNLAEQLVEEHGEFDPKADLEGYLFTFCRPVKEYGSGGVSVNKERIRKQ